jgi:hypothetical protein
MPFLRQNDAAMMTTHVVERPRVLPEVRARLGTSFDYNRHTEGLR